MEDGARTGKGDSALASPGGPPRQLGRYRIVAELGRGSTSIVYLAVLGGPQGFNKLFALKQLRASLAEDPAFVAMFLAEARLGARLSHPNVVSTLEIEDGEAQPYIVMEYLDGQSVHQVVTTARVAFTPIPLHLHLDAIGGAVEGLAYAHAAVGYDGTPLQVVHRDVSPHNVFITFSGLPKVLDFGIAQTADSPNLMPPSAGRASYMSPEQAAGESVDARSDLFSLGVMLWEAATRKRFWSEAHGKAEILEALASRRLPKIRLGALEKVDPDLQSLIVKATAPDPGDRYASAAALHEDLQAVLRRLTPPGSGPRDLGRRMLPLFGHERARLQAAIDTDLATAGGTPASTPTRLPPLRELATEIPTPEGALRVDGAPLQVRSEPVPPVESAVLRPLPTFPLTRTDRISGWIAQHQGLAVGAVVLGLMGGVGISMRTHGGSAQASRAPSAIAAPDDAPVAGIVRPPVDRPRADPLPEAAAAGGASAVATAQAEQAAHAVDVEALPHAWRTPRGLGPRGSEAARASVVHAEPTPAVASSASSLSQASRPPDSRAPGPPLRPIDSVNPYGP